jgi:hypothetical protein
VIHRELNPRFGLGQEQSFSDDGPAPRRSEVETLASGEISAGVDAIPGSVEGLASQAARLISRQITRPNPVPSIPRHPACLPTASLPSAPAAHQTAKLMRDLHWTMSGEGIRATKMANGLPLSGQGASLAGLDRN